MVTEPVLTPEATVPSLYSSSFVQPLLAGGDDVTDWFFHTIQKNCLSPAAAAEAMGALVWLVNSAQALVAPNAIATSRALYYAEPRVTGGPHPRAASPSPR